MIMFYFKNNKKYFNFFIKNKNNLLRYLIKISK